MQSTKAAHPLYNKKLSHMLRIFSSRFRRLCSRIRWMFRWQWHPKPKVVIRRFGNMNSKGYSSNRKSIIRSPNHTTSNKVLGNGIVAAEKPIRVATFNAALFTLAPAVSAAENLLVFAHQDEDEMNSSNSTGPKSILKQSPLFLFKGSSESDQTKLTKSKQKVSINLPENEISLSQNIAPMRSPICLPAGMSNWMINNGGCRTILDVLKEVNADILALQDVKAEEEKDMSPLSDLADALGMNYVFAESWAPEYGNAILSKWPIKSWKVQRIYDDKDFRNVLKATIEIPWTGLINLYCTQLDHLDENWRLKQINAIIESSDHPHILAGGLNSLDSSDYSIERWTDIVKYFEEIGKPTPKVQVTNLLKEKDYIDAKDYPGECEPVVMIAKGQSVQGTCKYGTRIDYILASKGLPYKFMPGSYSVVSSKGTSDHHLVKVDIMKAADTNALKRRKSRQKKKLINQRSVRSASSCSSGGILEKGYICSGDSSSILL